VSTVDISGLDKAELLVALVNAARPLAPIHPVAALPDGLHQVPDADYHQRAEGIISKGALDLVHRSPAHYRAWLDGATEEDTPTLAFGRSFHCALLEPERFARTHVELPDFGYLLKHDESGTTAEQGKANKERRNAWRSANAGMTWVEPADWTRVVGMCESVRRHPLASRVLSGGAAEQTIRWTDPETGLVAKARADYVRLSHRMIADVKSCQDASREAFRRDVAKYRYHVQNALYRMGFQALKIPVEHFLFIAVEKEPPYAVAVYSLDAMSVERGVDAARADIATLAECVRTGRYPGYPQTIQELDIPPWAA